MRALLVLGVLVFAHTARAETDDEKLVRTLSEDKCSASSESTKVARLGSVVERDEIDNERFAFVICKFTDLDSGEWYFRIWSNRATGSGLTSGEARKKAADNVGGAKYYTIGGKPIGVPRGKLDTRHVEYRVHHKGSEPTAIEVVVTMRDKKRRAKKQRSLKVNWPTD